MASTHTEIYRPFEGKLRRRIAAFWPIAVTGVRVAARKKLPLLILFAPVVIGTVIFSFWVYVRYSFLSGQAGAQALALAAFTEEMTEVRNAVAEVVLQTRTFALLVITWYGAGLLCDDRRHGAHQLWFARPITRLGYVLGKGSIAAFYGSLALVVPTLIICLVASFSSPDWLFLREDGEVILLSVAYGLIWVGVVTLIVLAASSLADRKSFAIAGTFAFFFLSESSGTILREIYDDRRYRAFGMFFDFHVIGEQVLGLPNRFADRHPYLPFLAVAVVCLIAASIVAWRLRRLEVVS